jgi:hypothetical protein
MGFPNQAQHFFYQLWAAHQGAMLWATRVCHMDIGYMVIVYWLDG